MSNLWEVKHPYYCDDQNYYAPYTESFGCTAYDSWADYMKEFDLAHTNMDMNLVWRWDWKMPDPEDYDTEGRYGEPEEVPTEEYLHIYMMGQRKGRFSIHIIEVTREDEPAIREYLTAYAEHMKKIWEPLL